MSYRYETERDRLWDPENRELFTAIWNKVNDLLDDAGAVRADEAIETVSGDKAIEIQATWLMLACLDRMVERGDIIDVSPAGCSLQHRVFTRPFRR